MHASRFRPLRSLLIVTMLLGLIAIPAHRALGTSQAPDDEGTAASRITWPEGVSLLAAQELDLPAGDYTWRVSTHPLTETDYRFEPGTGIVLATMGDTLVQIDDVDTLRLAQDAAQITRDDEEWTARSLEDDGSAILVIELVPVDETEDTPDTNLIGPLSVPEGPATLVLVDLDVDIAAEAASSEVMADALRPGVSIMHDEGGIPASPVPGQVYDRWIVALIPPVNPATVPAAPSQPATSQATPAPTTPAPAASPTTPATPTATASPTATDTPTATPTTTATNTPTATPTATPSPTATNTPTATPSPTPTNTPTATPTMEPTATYTPTPMPTTEPEAQEVISTSLRHRSAGL